jgi:Protein of unknown function (DUF4231)
MDKTAFDEIMRIRFDERLSYFGARRKRFLLLTRGSQVLSIGLSVMVPVIIATFGGQGRLVTIVLSSFLAIVTSVQSTLRFDDALLTARSCKEDLITEKIKYTARLGEYHGQPDPELFFVTRVEQIIDRYNAAQQRRLQKQVDLSNPIAADTTKTFAMR